MLSPGRFRPRQNLTTDSASGPTPPNSRPEEPLRSAVPDRSLPTRTERDTVSSRRTLILIGAVVIGGLAAFLTLNYVKGVESESAEENQLVDVLVAKGPIP